MLYNQAQTGAECLGGAGCQPASAGRTWGCHTNMSTSRVKFWPCADRVGCLPSAQAMTAGTHPEGIAAARCRLCAARRARRVRRRGRRLPRQVRAGGRGEGGAAVLQGERDGAILPAGVNGTPPLAQQ